MDISRDELFYLLKKWMDERTELKAIYMDSVGSVAARITGFVNGIADDILISDGSTNPNDYPNNHIIVQARNMLTAGYLETKDVPSLTEKDRIALSQKHGTALVRIVLKHSATLNIFER